MKLIFNFLDGEVQTFESSKQSLVIGRSPKADIVVSKDGFSRQHCLIDIIDGEIFVTDLASANGVYIDGKKIPPNQQVPFNTYLQLSIGPTKSVEIDIYEPELSPRRVREIPQASSPKAAASAGSGKIELNNTNTKRKLPKGMKEKGTSTGIQKTESTKEKLKSILNILIAITALAIAAYLLLHKEISP